MDFSGAFNERFQRSFVAFLLRDSNFLESVAQDVKPELFSSEHAQRLVRLVLDFHTSNAAAPDALIFQVIDGLNSRGYLSSELHKILSTYIDELFAVQLTNRGYLLREFSNFLRHQTFATSLFPAMNLVKQGKFDDAEELILSAFKHKAGVEDLLGTFYSEDTTIRTRRRREEDEDRLWTLIPPLDARIPGMKRGELGVLQSQRSSGGKSAALTFLARSAAYQRKNTLIYSMEMSEEDYEDRLDMCVTGLAKASLTDSTELALRLRKLFRLGAKVVIKQFPPGKKTVSDLRRHTERLQAVEGFVPDLIVVDYLTLLRPEKADKRDMFATGEEITEDLRAWGIEDKLFLWSAAQSNREAMNSPVADMQHIGTSSGIIYTADLVLSINRTPEEEKLGMTNMMIVKNRQGQARVTFSFKTDFNRMQFYVRDS